MGNQTKSAKFLQLMIGAMVIIMTMLEWRRRLAITSSTMPMVIKTSAITTIGTIVALATCTRGQEGGRIRCQRGEV